MHNQNVSQMTRTMKRERTAVVPQQAEQHPSAQLQKEGNQVQKARGKCKDMQAPAGEHRDIAFPLCLKLRNGGGCFNLEQGTKSFLS